MSFLGNIGGAIGDIAGALIGADASRSASNQQYDAATHNTELQRQIFEQNRNDQAPWRTAGANALDSLNQILSSTKNYTGPNSQDILNSPGYQFALNEGQKAIANKASATGGFGGAAMKSLSNWTSGNANQFYGDEFNRQQVARNNQLSPYFQLAGLGSTANQQAMQGGQNYANQAGQNSIFGGMAQAGNTLAQGNIWGNLASNLGARYDKYAGGNPLNNALNYVNWSNSPFNNSDNFG